MIKAGTDDAAVQGHKVSRKSVASLIVRIINAPDLA
jgi:hypothetical protein